ncbi:uncharacterized protein LOC133929539 isoform X2 [Phragmites australis]|uniref:uncharacterized protein LOC133929539 isoform X2 n=1 Tax=Phragmites australis TaxID=29695 RepID=UPI002D78729C|nr:uncharacterized protein LOC133929539 isoform X2 [Phragmites australis]
MLVRNLISLLLVRWRVWNRGSLFNPAVWRIIYVLVRTYRKDSGKKEAATDPAAATASTSSAATAEKPAEPIAVPREQLPPIPEDEQHQVYKWMLEEKRKIKPRNAAEKKKLNEEKALLKEFIRMGSLPSL